VEQWDFTISAGGGLCRRSAFGAKRGKRGNLECAGVPTVILYLVLRLVVTFALDAIKSDVISNLDGP